ncbi:hypothetical protein BC938DRAFT_481265 [Jimgerdemannia flammicorona]|uniref:Six-hairpin glycosidase-like protein n=1 Tax=Jimgerdemannia flammicorona TaxID=994334 RepID=A0A433QGH6_9FUNG|nr:hypothetical protein BC938DRAFT_481265 [Jimgerdemannia flammicorona]
MFIVALFILCFYTAVHAAALQLRDLSQHAQDLATLSITYMDQQWDEDLGFINSQYLEFRLNVGDHLTRETLWYSLGLLLRNNGTDHDRAVAAIHRVLDNQYDSPNTSFHGTFRRAPEEPTEPPAPVREYLDFDPNWREFCGTTLALLLMEYEAVLPADLVVRIIQALRLAAEGTRKRKTAPPRYTNIALMRSFVLSFVGDRLGVPDFVEHAEECAQQLYELWARDDDKTLWEYNSPTYYGPDIFALVLWTSYTNEKSGLVKLGDEILDGLWSDIGEFYHPGLRNFVGPYDRSYGVDMLTYQAIVGQWIWLAVGREFAPIPDLSKPFDHSDDWCFAVVVALLSPRTRIPAAVIPRLTNFTGDRTVRRVIAHTSQKTTTRLPYTPDDDPQRDRVVTAWLGSNVMIGAQASNDDKVRNQQFHPATIHWRTPTGGVGWFRAVPTTRYIIAKAGPGLRLEIAHPLPLPKRNDDNPRTFAFRMGGFSALDRQAEASALESGTWVLPGLTFSVVTNAVVQGSIVRMQEDIDGLGRRAMYAVNFTMEELEGVIPWLYIQVLL